MSRSTFLPSLACRLPRHYILSKTAARCCHRSLSTADSTFNLYNATSPSSSSSLRILEHQKKSRLSFIPSSSRFLVPSNRRSFISSAKNSAAHVLQNPRVGEDGENLWINISPRAAEVCVAIIPFSLFLVSLVYGYDGWVDGFQEVFMW